MKFPPLAKKIKPKYKDDDYLYATAYIKSVEDRGLSRETVRKMLEADDADAAIEILREAAGSLDAGAAAVSAMNADELIDAFVNASFKTVGNIVRDVHVFDFMKYQYDCNNIKTAIKCAIKGIKADGLYFGCGTVPVAAYAKMTSEHDYSALPGSFAASAASAADEYAKTGDPQSIDLTIDGASFEMTTAGADASGSKILSAATRMRVDATNVITAIRIIRMDAQSRRELLERAIYPYGSIKKEALIEASDENEAKLLAALPELGLPARFTDGLGVDVPLSAAERLADEAYISYAADAKRVTFGAEVPFFFLVEREYNAKNARIIIAGKRAGMSDDDIASRIRAV